MQTITQITQPQPCHESWAGMSATENGRFCSSCSKNVIDFTSMTNQQIIDHLSASGNNTCGRIYTGQFAAVNAELSTPQLPKAGLWKRLMLALALFSFVQQVKAQAPVSKAKTVQSQYDQITVGEVMVESPVNKSTVITGKVVDEQGKPLAEVTIVANKQSVITDAAGNFRLSVPAVTPSFEVRHIGYQTKTVKIGKQTSKKYFIKMEAAGMYLGGLGAVKRPGTIKNFYAQYLIKPIKALIG
ncbi:carboxypeptidase regulatory-like domain-containing protein [Mucilaginibacter galii]|uniref:Carboxypeptidase-like regulatory domain-containing protein n=1 Tax=Mucilaginibacter galii TaxID=2005073 RepID=A0A917J6J9_9SPHI|nr:carboxypeptidase regulatory-like domain-containing protein [Mucilaginibacter galii]GGI50095.1 hypothetical protein GCM10011425_13070 [Mucilaginibacter galii]